MRRSRAPPTSRREKGSVAGACLVAPLGPEVIVVSGACVSTVKLRLAGVASVLRSEERGGGRQGSGRAPSPCGAEGLWRGAAPRRRGRQAQAPLWPCAEHGDVAVSG